MLINSTTNSHIGLQRYTDMHTYIYIYIYGEIERESEITMMRDVKNRAGERATETQLEEMSAWGNPNLSGRVRLCLRFLHYTPRVLGISSLLPSFPCFCKLHPPVPNSFFFLSIFFCLGCAWIKNLVRKTENEKYRESNDPEQLNLLTFLCYFLFSHHIQP